MMAFVNDYYKFRWVGVGSCSDAQIYNKSQGQDRGWVHIGLSEASPIEEGGPDVVYYILGDDYFALKPWFMKPYSEGGLSRET